MGKAETTTDIAKWNQISEAQVERGELGDAEMVCGLVPQCSLGLQGTRRCCVYNGKRSNDELLEKCEVKHEKLDGDRTIYIGHVHAWNAVVTAFYTGTAIWGGMHQTVSRQHQHTNAHQEW
jgi:hypothetical protein